MDFVERERGEGGEREIGLGFFFSTGEKIDGVNVLTTF